MMFGEYESWPAFTAQDNIWLPTWDQSYGLGSPITCILPFFCPKPKTKETGRTQQTERKGCTIFPKRARQREKNGKDMPTDRQERHSLVYEMGKWIPFSFVFFFFFFRVHFGTTDVSRKKSRLLRSSRQASTTVSGTQQATKLPASKEESLRGQQKRRRKRLDPNQLLSYARLS